MVTEQNSPPTFGVVVPKVEGVVEPVADTGLGDVGLFGEVEENADVVLRNIKAVLWSLYTLYLHACLVIVSVGDSGLCCTCVTYFILSAN